MSHSSPSTPPEAASLPAAPAPPTLHRGRRLAILLAIGLGLGVFSAIVGWYRLPLGSPKAVGGYYCPLCGGTRAWWALCHGRVLASFRFNPLVWLMTPVLGYMGASASVWFVTGRPLPGFRDPWRWPRRWLWPLAVAVVLFTVLRNVPVWPLTWLGP